MSKLIAITGVTGQQGGGVVDVMLAAGWKVRGVTRNSQSDKAKILASKGVEIVSANFADEASLRAAFSGAQAIFAMTNFWEPVFAAGKGLKDAEAAEEADALRLARAAAATEGLEHYIFSSLPYASKVSGGKIPLPHLDGKARADETIRKTMPDLASRMTTLFFGFYPSNFNMPNFRPVELPGSYGKHILILPARADSSIQTTGDMTVTPGLWVRQILANPETTLGKYAGVGTELITFGDMLKRWSEVTGKAATIVTVSAETYTELWGTMGAELAAQCQFTEVYEDWRVGLEDKWVSREDLGITAEEAKGFKHGLETIKELL